MSTIASRAGTISSVASSSRNSVGAAAVESVRLNAGLALIRVITGLVFFVHGAQKVFVYSVGGVAESFSTMGIPFAGVAGPMVAFAELLGGLALILGLFTRAAGLGLVPVMLGALFLVHLPAGFFMPNGYEFVLLLGALAGGLALTGPGTYSIDAVIASQGVRSRWVLGDRIGEPVETTVRDTRD